MLAFRRTYKLSIQIRDTLKIYETTNDGVNLDLEFSVKKNVRGFGGVGDIKISGLSLEDMAFLSTNYNLQSGALNPSFLSLEVGYNSNNQLILNGNIIQAHANFDTTSNSISLEIMQNALNNLGKSVSVSIKDATLKAICQSIATNNNLTLDFQSKAQTKPKNYAYFGSALNQLNQFREEYPNIEAFIKGTQLIVRDADFSASNSYLINNQSGLIGSPLVTQTGIEITTLLNPYFEVGDFIKLESLKLKQLNGVYSIMEVTHDGALRSEKWTSKLVTLNKSKK